MESKETLVAVTEVGVFGDLDINDPTVTEVAQKKKDAENLDDLIAEAVTENAKISL